MKLKLFLFLTLLLGLYQTAESAIFTVTNFTNKMTNVKVSYALRNVSEKRLFPGQSVEFNTGFFGEVDIISWCTTSKDTNYCDCFKLSKAGKGFGKDFIVGALNVGGKFNIKKDGQYSYDFGVDGKGHGVGKKYRSLLSSCE